MVFLGDWTSVFLRMRDELNCLTTKWPKARRVGFCQPRPKAWERIAECVTSLKGSFIASQSNERPFQGQNASQAFGLG